MSLPTSGKPAQSSIRSFFQVKAPKYTPPPSSITMTATRTSPIPPAAAQPLAYTNLTAASPPTTPSPTNLPREASIRLITKSDINPLRRLNALLLPVSYPDSFYSRAADPETGRFSRVITWAHDNQEPKIVGGLVCRVEPDINDTVQAPQNLYIQSLCLLSPYRSMGLIAAALDDVVAAAVIDPRLNVKTVTAHVWTQNEEGLHWYESRGFTRQEPAIEGYYLKLRPDSAWLVYRPTSVSVRRALPSLVPPLSQPDITSITAAVMNLPSMRGTTPPPPTVGAASNGAATRPPPRAASGQSFQSQRPDMEWNDLPADMAPSLTVPSKMGGSEPGSGASSRSVSTVRKKKDRSYPAAAFGN